MMKRIALPLLALSLAALACTLTNEVRTTITTDDGIATQPARTVPGNTQTAPPPAPSPSNVSTHNTPAPAACIVTAHALTLRAGPGPHSPALDYLTQGEPLTVLLEDAAGWWKVETPTGKTGYINSTYCNERK